MSAQFLILLIVCFGASLLGPICGIGGGVIIKPVVDAAGIMSVSEASFLSGVCVLTMSLATFAQDAAAHKPQPGLGPIAPIAVGSAAGGVCGKALFSGLMAAFSDQALVGAAQALVLISLTVITAAYTLLKARIRPLLIQDPVPRMSVGFLAGACWSFLGIGGGPFNLAILTFFFAMDTKEAARASLFIIACSQIASLAYSASSGGIPPVPAADLAGACAMAVLGSVAGHALAAHLDGRAVDRLYLCALAVICVICGGNAVKFLALGL